MLEVSDKEEQYLHKAVSDVVKADSLVPDNKKDEATKLAVKQIKEGFRAAEMTDDQLINIVEAEAAKRNATVAAAPATPAATDRAYWNNYGYPYYGYYGYYPSYYPGYGYRHCLRHHSYRYCRRRLYGGKGLMKI